MNPAARAYLVELGAALLGYAALLTVSLLYILGNPTSPFRAPVALAPMVPALFILRAVLRYVSRLDELQRRIQFEALAFAFAGTALLTFSYGLLQNVGFPAVNWTWVWAVMASLWLLGQALAGRRYR